MLEDGFLIEQRYSEWQKKNVRTVVVNCHSRVPSQRSISAALGFAKPYDRIELVGGEYAETVTLTFPVELVAAEGEEAKVLSRGSGITITHDIEVYLSELDIVSKGKGRLEAGVVAMSGSVNMFRCKVNSIIAGGAAFLALERCTIAMSYNGVGLRVNDRAGGSLMDCTVNTHFSACIDVDTYGTLLVKKCMLSQPVGLGCVVVVSAAVSARARIMEDVSVEAYSAAQPKRLSLRSGMLFDAAGKLVKTPSTMNGIACQLVRFEQNTISVNVSSPPPPEVAFLQDLGGGNGAFAGLGAGNGLSSLTALSEGVASCVVISSGARPTFSRNELSEGDIGFLFEVSGTAKLKENTIRCQRLCGLLAFVDEDGVPASTTAATGDGDASNALTISSENVFDQCKIGIAVQRSGDELGSILQMSALAGIHDGADADSAGMLATGNLARVSANTKGNEFSWFPTLPVATRCDEEMKDAEGLAVHIRGQLVSAKEVEKALKHLVRVAAMAQVASLEAASMTNHYSPTSAAFPPISSNSENDILRFLNETLSLNFPSWVLEPNAANEVVGGDGTMRSHRRADQGARDVAAAQAELLRIRGSRGIDVVNTRFSNCELCALRFGQGGYGLVDRCDFENCGRAAVIVDSGAHPMITGCRFSKTEGFNVVVGNYANPFIFGNTISACQSSGIEVSQLGYGIIAGNSIMKNEGAGVVVRNSSSTIVFGNNIRYNTSGGIVSQYHGKPLIVRNVLVGNWLGQIRSEGYANPTLWHNTVASGRDIGILFSTCSSGTATANTISGNASHGIVTERDADPLVTCNDILRNQQCGIVVRDNGVGTFVGNDIIGNMVNNVFVIEGATAVLRRNTIREAGSAGVCVAEEGRGLIEHCSITDNTVANVIVADSHSSTVFVKNIIATSIEGVGILCCREGGGTFRENVIQNNKLSGVYVTSYGNLSFRKNTVTQEAVGILVTDRGKGVFAENKIVDNYGCGVIVQRQGDPLFTKNTISNAQTNGVLIGSDGRGEFRENEVFSNDVGIQLGSTLGTSEVSLQTQYAQSSEELQSEMEKNEVLAQQFHRRRSLLPTTQTTAGETAKQEDGSDGVSRNNNNNNNTTAGTKTQKCAQTQQRTSLASLTSQSMLMEYTESAGTGEPVRHSVRLEAVVSGNVLSRNTHCGLLVESHAHGTVERNSIHDNGHYGIVGDVLYSMRRAEALAHQERSTVALPAYNTTGGGEALVTQNTVYRHLTANIAILDIPDTDTRLEANEIHTAPVGVFVGNQSNANILLHNKIHHCADGVFVDNGGKGNFVGNTIEDCTSCGVYCSTGGQPRFTAENIIRRCSVAGILIDAYGAGTYSNCRISACMIGVVVHAGPCAVPSSNWHENILVGSAVYASAEFTGNTIEQNELHGVLALSSPLGHSIRERVCLRRREGFSSPHGASHGSKMGRRDSSPMIPQRTNSRASLTMDTEMTLAHWSSTIPQDPSGRFYPLFKGNRIRQNRFFGVFHDVLPAPLSSLPAGQSGSLAQLTTQVEARDELHFIAQRNRGGTDPNAHQPFQRSSSIASPTASSTHVSASSVAAAAAAAPRGTRVSSKSLPSSSLPSSNSTTTTRFNGIIPPSTSTGEGELEKNPAAQPHIFSPSQTLVKYMCFVDNDIEECTIGACVGSTCRPYFQDNRIVKNVFFGLFLRTRSQVLCRHCLISDNGIAGVYASFGALGIVASSAVLHNNGFRRDPGNPQEPREFSNTPASKSFFCPSSVSPSEYLESDCEQLLVRSSVKLQHIEAMHSALLDDSVRLLGELVAAPSYASSVAQYTFPQQQSAISEAGNLEAYTWRSKVTSIETDGNVTAAGGGIGVWLTEGCETVVRDSVIESNSQMGILFSRGADKVYSITRKSVPDIAAVQRALGGESNPEPEEAEWHGATKGIRYTLPKGGKFAQTKREAARTHPPSTFSFVCALEAKGYLFMTKSLFSSVPKEIVASFFSRNAEGPNAVSSSRSGSFAVGGGVGAGVSLVNMDSLLEGNFSITSTTASGSFEGGKEDGYFSSKSGASSPNRQKDSQLHNPHAIATVYRNRIVSNGTGICVQLFNTVATVDSNSRNPSTDASTPSEKESRTAGKPSLSSFDVGTPQATATSRGSLKRDAVILPSRWQSTWLSESVSSGDEIAHTLAEMPEKLPLLALHAMSESHFSVLPHVVNVSYNEVIGNVRHGIQCVHLLEIDAAAHVKSRTSLNEALESQESLRMQWNHIARKERQDKGDAGAAEPTVQVLLSLAARPKKTRHAIVENNELRRNTQDQILVSAHVVVIAEDETKISLAMDTTTTPDVSTLSSKLLVQVPIVASLIQSASPGIFLVQRNVFSEGAVGVRLLGPLDGNSVRLRFNRFNGLTSSAVSVDGHLACGIVGEGNYFVDNRLAGQVLVPQTGRQEALGSGYETTSCNTLPTRVFGNTFDGPGQVSLLSHGCEAVAPLFIYHNDFTSHPEGTVAVLVCGERTTLRLTHNSFTESHIPLIVSQRAGKSGKVVIENNHFKKNVIGALLSGGSTPELLLNLFSSNSLCGMQIVGADTQPRVHTCVFMSHKSNDDENDHHPCKQPHRIPSDCTVTIVKPTSTSAMTRASPLTRSSPLKRFAETSAFLLANTEYTTSSFSGRTPVVDNVEVKLVYPKFDGDRQTKLPSNGSNPAESNSASMSLLGVVPSGLVVGRGAGGVCESCLFQDNDVGVDIYRDAVASSDRPSAALFTLKNCLLNRHQYTGVLIRGSGQVQRNKMAPLLQHTTLETNAVVSGCYFVENACVDQTMGDIIAEDNGFAIVEDSVMTGVTQAKRGGYAVFRRNLFIADAGAQTSDQHPAFVLHAGNRSSFTENTILHKRLGAMALQGTWAKVEHNLFLKNRVGVESAPLCNAAFSHNRIVASSDCGLIAYGGIFSSNEVSGCPVGVVLHNPSAWKKFAALVASRPTEGTAQLLFFDNVVHACDTDGILVAGGGKISGNRVFNCKTNIHLVARAPTHEMDSLPLLSRNVCYDGETGIILDSDTVGTVSEQEVFDNSVLGVLVNSGSTCVVERNQISSALDHGAMEVSPDSSIKNTQNLIRNQFSPAYNKGLQSVRVKDRVRAAAELSAEMSAVEDTAELKDTEKINIANSMSQLCSTVNDDTRVGKHAWQLSQKSPDPSLAGSPFRSARGGRFSTQGMSTTDDTFSASGTSASIARKRSARRRSSVGFADDSPRSRRKSAAVSFTAKADASTTLKSESSVSRQSSSRFANMGSFSRRKSNVSVGGEEASPPKRQPSAPALRKPRSSVARASVTSVSGDGPTNYGRQKQRRASRAARDAKAVVERQQRNSNSLSDVSCVHDVLIHVVLLRNATQRPSLGSDSRTLNGDAVSAAAAAAGSPTEPSNSAADNNFKNGSKDAQMERTIAMEQIGQSVASAFSSISRSVSSSSSSGDMQKAKEELKFSCVITTNAVDLSTYLATTTPSISVTVLCTSLEAEERGVSSLKSVNIAKLEFSEQDKNSLVQLSQCFAVTRSRKSSSVGARTQSLRLSFVVCPSALLERVHVSEKRGKRGNGTKAKKRASTTALQCSAGGITLEDYSAACTAVIGYSKEVSDCREAFVAAVKEELNSSNSRAPSPS